MKTKLIAGALALTLIISSFSFTGCSNDSSQTSDSSKSDGSSTTLEKTDFNLGYLNSTAHLLAFVAKEEGYFEEEGLNVTLTQFSSASELSTGLESGKLDVAFIGSVPSLTFLS